MRPISALRMRTASLVMITLGFAPYLLALTEHHGEVRLGDVPVPAAVVQARHGNQTLQTVTSADGTYSFPEISDGTWTFQVTKTGFETLQRELVVAADSPTAAWNLSLLPWKDTADTVGAGTGFPLVTSTVVLETSPRSEDAANRLLINGTVNNGAATTRALPRAIGNNRAPGSALAYRTSAFVAGGNSLFDARSFSLTGQNTPRPDYSRLQGTVTFGGPVPIPFAHGLANFNLSYSRTQNRNASVHTAQVPTAAERRGDFSHIASAILDPVTNKPFFGNIVPDDRISPQATELLNLYPLPNFEGAGRYNYQVPVVGVTHGDNVQGTITNINLDDDRNLLSATAALRTTRSDDPDVFGFTDNRSLKSTDANLTWVRRLTKNVSANIRFAFSRTVSKSIPYFGNRQDVSGNIGIAGNDRDPRNWGPPSLTFSSGIATLATGSHSFDRNQSAQASYSSSWRRTRHSITYGADFRRQRFNILSQQNARGNFTFVGAATGNDFADFLLSIPTASSIAFGNADKYFRQSFANAYVTDDFRVTPKLTLNLGVRWEYESPITELQGRLVNLELTPDFASASAVIAGTSSNSLLVPDRRGFEPRVGVAWRPREASSFVVRAGYGIYRDTSVYRSIADQMAQQSPLSKSLSVQNTPSNPLTLADGFRGSPSVSTTTFAIDPHFRPGTAQNWNLIVQHDLPAALQVTATYLGIKGTHVPQRILPNTFPTGSPNTCSGCATGFVYMMSNGTTSRHAGTVEVRRRQRSGFEASVQYTYSKAIDNAGLGGNHVAQNWLDLRSERALSSFDQRHQLVVQGQYTTGALAGLSNFWNGWRSKLFREWTLTSQLTLGSGTPLTPVILAPVTGTGMIGSLRPNLTGAAVHAKSGGVFLNPEAFAPPDSGTWGNAARNSITGPAQFAMNASLTRTFRLNQRVSMDLTVNSTNVLNRVTFPSWTTIVNSPQFGLPMRANPMRTIQPSLRVRF